MNKSNIDKYVPPYSVSSHKFYWIGARKADWINYKTNSQFKKQNDI